MSTELTDREPGKRTADFRGAHNVLDGVLLLPGGPIPVDVPRTNGSVTPGQLMGLSLKSRRLHVEFVDPRSGSARKTVSAVDLCMINPGLEITPPSDEEIAALQQSRMEPPVEPKQTQVPVATEPQQQEMPLVLQEPPPASVEPARWSFRTLLRRLTGN